MQCIASPSTRRFSTFLWWLTCYELAELQSHPLHYLSVASESRRLIPFFFQAHTQILYININFNREWRQLCNIRQNVQAYGIVKTRHCRSKPTRTCKCTVWVGVKRCTSFRTVAENCSKLYSVLDGTHTMGTPISLLLYIRLHYSGVTQLLHSLLSIMCIYRRP